MGRQNEDFQPLDPPDDEDEAPEVFPAARSHAAVAQDFVKKHQTDIRYEPEFSRWYIWDGKLWKPDNANKIRTMSLTFCAKESETVSRTVANQNAGKEVGSRTMINSVVSLASATEGVVIDRFTFDADPFLLNAQNGIVDLCTGRLHPHDRTKFCSQITSCQIAPTEDCPTWKRFLREATDDDVDFEHFLQMAVGYMLSGDVSAQVFFFLWGLTNTGKGSFPRHDQGDVLHLSPPLRREDVAAEGEERIGNPVGHGPHRQFAADDGRRTAAKCLFR